MVSILWSIIAFSSGLMMYCVAPILAQLAPAPTRQRVSNFYTSLSMKSFQQVAILRRLLGSYELLTIGVDDEHKMAEVTVDSGVVSDDKTVPFKDPDDRILRLHSKPVTVLIESVPAAIDAELSELGYWTRQEHIENGLEQEQVVDRSEDGETATEPAVNPYVTMADDLRVVDPVDMLSLVLKNVKPENIITAEELTKARFNEYGSNIGAAEIGATAVGFAFGVGGVAVLGYVRDNLIDASSNGPTSPIELGAIAPDVVPLVDAAMQVVVV